MIIWKIKIFPASNFRISSAKGGRPVKFSITEYIITRSTYPRRTRESFPRHLSKSSLNEILLTRCEQCGQYNTCFLMKF